MELIRFGPQCKTIKKIKEMSVNNLMTHFFFFSARRMTPPPTMADEDEVETETRASRRPACLGLVGCVARDAGDCGRRRGLLGTERGRLTCVWRGREEHR